MIMTGSGAVSSSVYTVAVFIITPYMRHASDPPFPARWLSAHITYLSSDIMGLAGVLSVFVVKKQEKPWEVVDSKTVEPVPLFDEDDGACAIPVRHSASYSSIHRYRRHHLRS